MSLIYLIRHGEPASGWGEPEGSPDPGLTDLGHKQARAVGARLAALQGAEKPTRLLTSPLRRCRQTAEPFAELSGLSPEVAPAVAEIPTPAGVVGPDRAPWLRTAMAGRWSEIDGIDGVAWRDGVVAALLQAGGAAVFTHFVAINAAVSAATGADTVLAFRPAQGSITTLRIDGGHLKLEQLGESLTEAGRVL